jgi:hypothetical protein
LEQLTNLTGLAEQAPGEVESGNLGAAPGQRAGEAPVPARDVKNPQAGNGTEQVEEGCG